MHGSPALKNASQVSFSSETSGDMEQHDHFKALQRVSTLSLQRISALDVRDSKDRVNRSVHVEAEPGSGFDGIEKTIPRYR